MMRYTIIIISILLMLGIGISPVNAKVNYDSIGEKVIISNSTYSISLYFYNTMLEAGNSYNITYSRSAIIDVKVDAPSYKKAIFKVYNIYNDLIFKESLKNSRIAFNLSPGLYYFILDVTTENDHFILNSSKTEDIEESKPCYIKIKSVLPEVDLKVVKDVVVIGDIVKFKVTVNGIGKYKVLYELQGAYDNALSYALKNSSGIFSDVDYLITGKEYIIHLYTDRLLPLGSDYFSLYVKILDGQNIVTSKNVKFKLVRPSLTLNTPEKTYTLNYLKISGSTNVADTLSDIDSGNDNYVYIFVFTSNQSLIEYKFGKYVVSNIKKKDIVIGRTFNNYTIKVPIIDGKWAIPEDIFILPEWTVGSYEIDAVVVTNLTLAQKAETAYNYEDIAVKHIIVDKPEIIFKLNKEYLPGEKITLRGEINVRPNEIIIISNPKFRYNNHIEYLFVYDPLNTAINPGDTIEAKVGTNKEWITRELYINPYALEGKYTISAYLINDSTVTTTININITKKEVKAELERTLVWGGLKVKLTIESPTDMVFLFTDDNHIFSNILKLPGDMGDITSKPFIVKTDKKKTEVLLTVSPIVEEGEHVLYVIASPDGEHFNMRSGLYTEIAFTAKKVGIINYPKEIRMTMGSKCEVYIEVLGEPGVDIFLGYAVKGIGFEIPLNENISGNGVKLNNNFIKLSKTKNDTWIAYAILYPYYDPINESLTPTFNSNTKILDEGIYTFKIYEYIPVKSGFHRKKIEIPLIVEKPNINVSVPEYVLKGQPLKIEIRENRSGIYNNIYVVVFNGVIKKILERITLKDGYSVVTIPTSDLPCGLYHVYVRDTMGTMLSQIDYIYDIPPNNPYARKFYAQDDIFWVGVLKIVKAIPTVTNTPNSTPITTTTTSDIVLDSSSNIVDNIVENNNISNITTTITDANCDTTNLKQNTTNNIPDALNYIPSSLIYMITFIVIVVIVQRFSK